MKMFLVLLYFQYLMHEIENVLANERIKQITEEIMRPDSKQMKKINAKTREIMQPNSKYMKEINQRLGQVSQLQGQ